MSSSGAESVWTINALVDKDGFKDLCKKNDFSMVFGTIFALYR